MGTPYHYAASMRRLWLTILTTFAFVASGFAGVAAMPACPMQTTHAAMAAVAQHDCCPDAQPTRNNGAPQDHKMDGCLIGMTCGAAPLVAPSLAPIELSAVSLRLTQPILGEPAPPSGPLQELFRPPRTI